MFTPLLQGRIPLNLDWLVTAHYPWMALTDETIQNPDIDDPAIEFYPLYHRAVHTLRDGELPLWNPDIGCGSPQIADFISKPLDPLLLITAMLPVGSAYGWALLLLMQLLLLSFLVSGFLLSRKCSVIGASIGATAVVFSAPLVTWMQMRTFTATFISLFAALWAWEANRTRPRVKIALCGLALSYCALAGHAQFALYAWLIAPMYFLATSLRKDQIIQPFMHIIAIFTLALAIGSPSILMEVELLQHTVRGEPNRYFSMFRFGLAPWLTLFTPDIIGHPTNGDYFGKLIYYRSYTTLPVLYFGALPLTVIFLSIRRKLPGKRLFLYAPTVFLALLTIAGLKPVRLWLRDHFHGLFDMDPARAGMLASVFLAVWAGHGATYVFSRDFRCDCSGWKSVFMPFAGLGTILVMVATLLTFFDSELNQLAPDNSLLLYFLKVQEKFSSILRAPFFLHMLLVFLLAALVVLLSIRLPRKTHWITAGIVLVLFVDLMPWTVRFNRFVSREVLELGSAHEAAMANHRDPLFRAAGIDRPGRIVSQAEVFPPDTLLLYDVPEFRFYSSTPLANYAGLINRAQKRTYWDRSIKPVVIPLLKLAGVKWFYTAPDLQFPVATAESLEQLPGLNVYTNSDAMPRIRLTGIHPWSPQENSGDQKPVEGDDIWEWLSLYPERFRHQSIVNSSELLSEFGDVPNYVEGTVKKVNWSDHRIDVLGQSETAALLVLADTWYPGWKAVQGGNSLPVIRVNGMFRGVRVPRGEWSVSIKYAPVTVRLGLFLMLVGLLVCVVLCFKGLIAGGLKE